jgi:hypothetical protein
MRPWSAAQAPTIATWAIATASLPERGPGGMADALGLGSSAARRGGSSPPVRSCFRGSAPKPPRALSGLVFAGGENVDGCASRILFAQRPSAPIGAAAPAWRPPCLSAIRRVLGGSTLVRSAAWLLVHRCGQRPLLRGTSLSGWVGATRATKNATPPDNRAIVCRSEPRSLGQRPNHLRHALWGYRSRVHQFT